MMLKKLYLQKHSLGSEFRHDFFPEDGHNTDKEDEECSDATHSTDPDGKIVCRKTENMTFFIISKALLGWG